MTEERRMQILNRVGIYNNENEHKEGYMSPYMARLRGRLGEVATQIGVDEPELREFLTIMEKELPQDHLHG
jgi:hypothetical protein